MQGNCWERKKPTIDLALNIQTQQLFVEAPISWGSDASATLSVTLQLPAAVTRYAPRFLKRAAVATGLFRIEHGQRRRQPGAQIDHHNQQHQPRQPRQEEEEEGDGEEEEVMLFTVPITARNLQVSAHARITARPLLEEFPYAGSLSVSLMSPPHVDFELPLRLPSIFHPHLQSGKSSTTTAAGAAAFAWAQRKGGEGGGGLPAAPPAELDLMALPVVRGLFHAAVRLAAQRAVVYPRCWQVHGT
jgi:hypothetical protein